MKCRIPAYYAFLAVSLALAGCAGDASRYPSLQIRPGERVSGTFDPVEPDDAPVPVAVASADLLARIGQLRAEAVSAHQDFLAAAPAARREANAASGAAIGSDAWASAQVALADLDSARSRVAVPLGELDVLYVDATVTNDARTEIALARDSVIALLREEDAVLADLRANVQ